MFATVVYSMIQKLKLASSTIASVPLFIFEFSLRLNSTSFSPASELFGSTYLKHTIYRDHIQDPLRMFGKPSILTAPQFGISATRGTLHICAAADPFWFIYLIYCCAVCCLLISLKFS